MKAKHHHDSNMGIATPGFNESPQRVTIRRESAYCRTIFKEMVVNKLIVLPWDQLCWLSPAESFSTGMPRRTALS